MKLFFESALVCTGTLLAALLVIFGEPARADLLIAEAARTAEFSAEGLVGAASLPPGAQ